MVIDGTRFYLVLPFPSYIDIFASSASNGVSVH